MAVGQAKALITSKITYLGAKETTKSLAAMKKISCAAMETKVGKNPQTTKAMTVSVGAKEMTY